MKVMWYLPIIPKMKRLFANPNDAKNLRWHVDERKCDGMYRNPVDSIQWRKFDDEFLEFSKESKNIRLGLTTDGMNSFGNEYKSQFMACFTSYLQLTSWIVHEEKIHDVVYDDIWSETTRE